MKDILITLSAVVCITSTVFAIITSVIAICLVTWGILDYVLAEDTFPEGSLYRIMSVQVPVAAVMVLSWLPLAWDDGLIKIRNPFKRKEKIK